MAWLSGWNNRIELTIYPTGIDADLTDFPILVKLSDGSGINGIDFGPVFTELSSDSNRKKIAITTDDGTTECYVEIEDWDTANESAALHTKIPLISSTVNTVIFFYYDSAHADNTTYVGDVGSTQAQSVWDVNFMAVHHLCTEPGGDQLDSTSNNNDGTTENMAADDLIDSNIGKGLEFDGVDDHIRCGSDSSVQITGDMTIEAWHRRNTSDSAGLLAVKSYEAANTGWYLHSFADGSARLEILGASGHHYVKTDRPFLNNTWNYSVGRRDGDIIKAWVNDGGNRQAAELDSDESGSIAGDTQPYCIGARWDGVNPLSPYPGGITEVRLSNISRSDAWLKATFYSNRDWLLAATIPAASNWATGFTNRFSLSIDSNLIDSDLTEFPMLIKISSASGIDADDLTAIFSELGSYDNRKKIAVTVDSGEQCFIDIVKWDHTNQKAWLFVRIPEVSSSQDTNVYLHYDADAPDNNGYVGDLNSRAASFVWDENFILVYHLSFNPSATNPYDSTYNSHDGTDVSMSSANIVTDGKAGDALNFDGVSDYIRTNADYAALRITGDITLEACFRATSYLSGYLCGRLYLGQNKSYALGQNALGLPYLFIDDGVDQLCKVSGDFVDSAWHYMFGRRSGSALTTRIDHGTGDSLAEEDFGRTGAIAGSGVRFAVGARYDNVSGKSPYKGDLDEIRVSNIARSDAWLKASKYSINDTLIALYAAPPVEGGNASVINNEVIHSAIFGGSLVR